MTRPNLALYVPAAIAGLAVIILLILGAHSHGKRRVCRAWLIDRSTS